MAVPLLPPLPPATSSGAASGECRPGGTASRRKISRGGERPVQTWPPPASAGTALPDLGDAACHAAAPTSCGGGGAAGLACVGAGPCRRVCRLVPPPRARRCSRCRRWPRLRRGRTLSGRLPARFAGSCAPGCALPPLPCGRLPPRRWRPHDRSPLPPPLLRRLPRALPPRSCSPAWASPQLPERLGGSHVRDWVTSVSAGRGGGDTAGDGGGGGGGGGGGRWPADSRGSASPGSRSVTAAAAGTRRPSESRASALPNRAAMRRPPLRRQRPRLARHKTRPQPVWCGLRPRRHTPAAEAAIRPLRAWLTWPAPRHSRAGDCRHGHSATTRVAARPAKAGVDAAPDPSGGDGASAALAAVRARRAPPAGGGSGGGRGGSRGRRRFGGRW